MLQAAIQWILLLMLVTCAVAFLALVALTIVVTFRVQPWIARVRADAADRRRLFRVLLINIAVVGVGAFTNAFFPARTQAVRSRDAALDTTLRSWSEMSMQWMNEPSGLAAAHGAEGDEHPMLLAVDDDEPRLFALDVRDSGHAVIRHALPIAIPQELVAPDDGRAINDLEGVAADHSPDRSTYYALTSHRRMDGRATRRLLRFTLPDLKRAQPDDTVYAAAVSDLSSLPQGPSIHQFLMSHGVAVDTLAWQREDTTRHPFALEAEGLIVVDGVLYVGLKWPLDAKRNAIMLAFDPRASRFTGLYRLSLNAQGISALGFDRCTRTLLVAANPPDKADPEDPWWKDVVGRSELWTYAWPMSADSAVGREILNVRVPGAKLEGVAVTRRGVFLAYDGAQGRVERRRRRDVFPQHPECPS